MKKNKKQKFIRITAIILALLMVVPMIISALATVAYGAEIIYVDDTGKKYTLTDFRDTQGHWAQTQIRSWANYQIINGYNGDFMPNNAITRCDLACIIDRLMGLTYTSYNSFRDLQVGQYYTDSMLKCYASGYIQGDGKDLRPMDTATREEVATILFRVFNMEEERSNSKFTDSASISSWASAEVATLASKGFIKGYPDGSFGPQNNITRAELITMLDNIVAVYITPNVKSSDTITNQWDGNAVINKRGMTLSRSSISENLYCTQSCTSISLVDTSVEGNIFLFADKMTLDLKNSEISTVYSDSVATIRGVENIDTLIVSYEGSGTTISEMPSTLVLEAGASIVIGRATYVNDSNKSKTYDSEEIYADIAKDGYTLENSPTISLIKMKITADNIVSFEDLKPGQRGTGELKSFGLLIMEGTNVPTLDDYDDKISYRASYLDDYYRENGGTRGRISEEIGKIDDGETYTYVPYAVNYGGMVAYGEPHVLKGYDFDYSMLILDTGNYPKSVKAVLTLEGSNIPPISDVTCYYDVTPAYVSERNSRVMSLMRITDTDTRYEVNSSNERILYSVVINEYMNPSTKEYQIPTYFGYKIRFSDGSIFSEFPYLLNARPDALSPISSIKTGQTSTSGSVVSVNDCYIKTLNTVVNQYGVVYSYTNLNESASSDFFDDSWSFMAGGSSIPLNTEFNYSIKLNKEEGKDIHYAAYVRTVEGYYFGDVKTYKNTDAGDVYISAKMSALVLPDDSTLVLVDSNNSLVEPGNSLLLNVYDVNRDSIRSFENSYLTDYMLHSSTNAMSGTRIFLSLLTHEQISGLKVQLKTNVSSDAHTEYFEDVISYKPYLYFSNETDGIFTYNVILDDNVDDLISDFDIVSRDERVSFDKENMTIKSSYDLSSTGVDVIFTIFLKTYSVSPYSQSYFYKLKVQ